MEKNNTSFNDFLNKFDNKILKAKIQTAIDMIKDGDYDALGKKLKNVDKEDLLKKLNTCDQNILNDILTKDEIKQISKKFQEIDIESLSSSIGDKGNDIVQKIKQIITERDENHG